MKIFNSILLVAMMVAGLPSLSVAQINAGSDQTICQGQTVTLNAVATGGYGTDSYTFEVYSYQPETYSGGTPVTFGGNQDDQVSGPFPVGFQFCFFNQNYTQFYIGSNGWIGFTNNTSWTTYTSQAIPSTSSSVPKNCIMAPWQDWHPGVASSNGPPYVFYKTIGTAPNRKLVVYWYQCPMYSCTTTYGTFQIVLNEQSSIIENHLTNKPNCTTWAGGTATQGVHNSTGTVAFTATGRNSTQWIVSNESTRFVPSGIKWYTGGYPNGTIVGYGPELIVTPSVTTVYTAVVSLCGGQVYTDNVTVTVIPQDNAGFSYGSSTLCQSGNSGLPVTSFPGGSYAASPPGLVINPSTGNINLGASAVGSYTVIHITTGACPDTATIMLTVVSSPSALFTYPEPAYCVTAPNPVPVFPPGSSAGTFTATPAGLVFANIFTGEVNLAGSIPGIYNITNTIPPSAACPQVSWTTQLEVLTLPPAANIPQGPASLCENPVNTQYGTPPMPNTISYQWAINPASAGVINGTGPVSTVNWNDIFIGQAAITVRATNACGSGLTSPPLVVTVYPLPKETGTPVGPATLCQSPGLTQYFTSGSAYASYYEWLLVPVEAGTVTGNGQTISISFSAGFSGNAQLAVRGVNECGTSVWSSPLDIEISPVPAAASQPFGPVSFCSGTESTNYITQLVNNATGYVWNLVPASAGIVNSSNNTAEIFWDPAFAGQGSLSVMAQNDCGNGPASPPLIIIVNALPVPFAGNDTTVMFGASVVLKASVQGNTGSMQYHWEPAAMLVDPDILRPTTVSLTNSVSFTFTATDMQGNCTASDAVLVEVQGAPLVAFAVAIPPAICVGNSALLEVQAYGGAAGNYQYSWYVNGVLFSNLQSLVVIPSETTVYEIVSSDGFGTFTTTVTVEVWQLPKANAGSDIQTPYGTQVLLSGEAIPPGVYTYAWQPADSLDDASLQNPTTIAMVTSTLFSLVVTDIHGCVSPADEVAVSVAGGSLAANPMAVPDTICMGGSATLFALPAGGLSSGYTYKWRQGGSLLSDQSSFEISPGATTTYQLELTDGFSTIYRDVTVTVNLSPVINLIGPGVPHEGNTILSCVFDTISVPLNNSHASFLWSDGSTGNKITLWTSGLSFDFRELWVQVTDTITQCMSREEFNVLFNFINCSYGVDDSEMRIPFLVYPNPAGVKVFIRAMNRVSNDCTVQLFGIRGELLEVFHEQWSGEGIELNLRNYAEGLYLLKVISGSEISVVKLIISGSLRD